MLRDSKRKESQKCKHDLHPESSTTNKLPIIDSDNRNTSFLIVITLAVIKSINA